MSNSKIIYRAINGRDCQAIVGANLVIDIDCRAISLTCNFLPFWVFLIKISI